MKLQRRERILLSAALGVVVLCGLWYLLLAGDGQTNDQLIKRKEELAGKIDEDQNLLDKAARDAKRLADWQRRALPPDPVLARSLYLDWLRAGRQGRVESPDYLDAIRRTPRSIHENRLRAAFPGDTQPTGAVLVRVLFGRLSAPDSPLGHQTEHECP